MGFPTVFETPLLPLTVLNYKKGTHPLQHLQHSDGATVLFKRSDPIDPTSIPSDGISQLDGNTPLKLTNVKQVDQLITLEKSLGEPSTEQESQLPMAFIKLLVTIKWVFRVLRKIVQSEEMP